MEGGGNAVIGNKNRAALARFAAFANNFANGLGGVGIDPNLCNSVVFCHGYWLSLFLVILSEINRGSEYEKRTN